MKRQTKLLLLVAGGAGLLWWLVRRKTSAGSSGGLVYTMAPGLEDASKLWPAYAPQAIYEDQLTAAQAAIDAQTWYPEQTFTAVLTRSGEKVGEIDVWGIFHDGWGL